MNFPFNEGAYKYRPLRKTKRVMRGWDVYALQTALDHLGYGLGPTGIDGYLGKYTSDAIWDCQYDFNLKEDGIAGVDTQKELGVAIVLEVQDELNITEGLLYGQVSHESSYWLGNYTAPYTDGSRDCGVVQRNTNFTPKQEGFKVPESINALGQRIITKYGLYYSQTNNKRRSWELAAGSWNAPTWTDTLARGGTLSPSQYEHITNYIDDVTAYVDWNETNT